jgi:hypothetical protein
MMPTREDLVKLACYIDGEGTIVIIKARKHYTQLVVRIANTDPRLPMWCYRTFGGKIYASDGKGNQRRYYTWVTQSQKAENILRLCLPHFLLKREQALVALEYRDTFQHRKGRIPEQDLTEDRQVIRKAFREKLSRLKYELPESAFDGVPEPPTRLLQ